jgi:transposase
VIVIGVDPHKLTHTAAAVDRATGEVLDDLTVAARQPGFVELVKWAEDQGSERLWALEYGRHLVGALERFLLGRGERVVRVAPKLMAAERKVSRGYGKSDAIDALAIARAAIREPDLPAGRLDGPEREIAILVEHRDQLVGDHTRMMRRLRWLLHDLDPALEPPSRALSQVVTIDRLSRRLAKLPQSAQVRVCRDLLRLMRDVVKRCEQLKAELAVLVARHGKPLLEICGCGVLTAARILGDVGDVRRFKSDAQLASYAGVSPLDASSGQQQRHRLNRRGNRKLNRSMHFIVVTQLRIHPAAKAYFARRLAEGKTNREAMRALKRLLIRIVYRALQRIAQTTTPPSLPGTAPLTCLT